MPSAFDQLREFILHGMRMSHIYQPVMLMELLKRGGSASVNQIAQSLLVRDHAQIDSTKECVVESQMTAKTGGFGMRGVL